MLAIIATAAFSEKGIVSGILFLLLAFLCSPFGHHLTDHIPQNPYVLILRIVIVTVMSLSALFTFPTITTMDQSPQIALNNDDGTEERTITSESTPHIPSDVLPKQYITNKQDEKRRGIIFEKIDQIINGSSTADSNNSDSNIENDSIPGTEHRRQSHISTIRVIEVSILLVILGFLIFIIYKSIKTKTNFGTVLLYYISAIALNLVMALYGIALLIILFMIFTVLRLFI